MSSQIQLELKGNLSEHPFAELLAETTQAKLTGSIRLESGGQKAVVYLKGGHLVFAVSNSRQHRLFIILLNEKKITKADLVKIENFDNDQEFRQNLVAQNLIAQPELDALCRNQIQTIIIAGLGWTTGTWEFSPLVRIKEGIQFEFDVRELLLNYSRSLSRDKALQLFKSDNETLGVKPDQPAHLNLQSHEAFVLSRFEGAFLKLSEIDAISGLSENITRQVLYSLWLGGFLFRHDWNPALSESTINRFLSAKLHLRREDEQIEDEIGHNDEVERPVATEAEPDAQIEITPEPVIDPKQLLIDYLSRVENASNLYEVLDVPPDSDVADIKLQYLALAKYYHPDLFYRQGDVHDRVQNAFSNLAHAYETLRTKKSRDVYDYKMRRELAQMQSRREAGISGEDTTLNKQADQAEEQFKIGFELLTADSVGESIPFFARSVHFNSGNARYHAFYGKALSGDKKQHHKAEGEIQTAIKIDPDNTTYRLMLAELFVHIGLVKRAEGELNRLLSVSPNDREAIALLDSLQRK